MSLAAEGFIEIGASRLEYRMIGPQPDEAATFVLLHEGLGSVGLWGDFPDRLAAATGLGVFAYSRAGYGRSSASAMPRRTTSCTRRRATCCRTCSMPSGSNAASCSATATAPRSRRSMPAASQDHRIGGLVLIAPHFFTEAFGVAEIARMRELYANGDLRAKLARWHHDPDNAFYGWSGPWLDPEFRKWDITEELAYIRVPMLIIQGEDDQYGTLEQVETAKEACQCPVEAVILPGVRHIPHREAAEETLRAIVDFTGRLRL